MQLKIQRSQRTSTLGAAVFCLDLRAEYAADERANISRYRLAPQVIYSSRAARRHFERAQAQMERTRSRNLREQVAGIARGAFSLARAHLGLHVSIGSLARGHHIECRDLEELVEAEDTLREACKGLTRYLDVASTFDGSQIVIEYERGEERVHITQNAPALLEYQPEDDAADARPGEGETADRAGRDAGQFARRLGARWAVLEREIVESGRRQGLYITERQLRWFCGAVALVLVVFVVRVL